jgi:hypothetical protein
VYIALAFFSLRRHCGGRQITADRGGFGNWVATGGYDLDMTTITKTCTKCGVEKGLAEFSLQVGCTFGVRGDCKVCVAERNRRYREQHREEERERVRRYHEKNREARLEYNRRYYKRNREAELERKSRYYEENRDVVLEGQRLYRKENRDVVAERNRLYREENRDTVAEYKRQYRKKAREALLERRRRRADAGTSPSPE